MAGRMSNRERVQKAAAEAAAKAKEKAEKKTAAPKTTTTRKRATKTPTVKTRQMKAWKVFDNSFKEVSVFRFPQKAEAEAEAKRLSEKTGKTHFVNEAMVPMEEA